MLKKLLVLIQSKVTRTVMLLIVMLLIAVSSFLIGKNSSNQQTEKEIVYKPGDLISHIIDWNTDGYELSIMLDDESEIYAYRNFETDIYKGNRVERVEETDEHVIVYKRNGTFYTIDKKGNRHGRN